MDNYSILITRQAAEHLSLIGQYIAIELKQPGAAKRMHELLRSTMLSLGVMPYRFGCVDEQPWRGLEFRMVRAKNYYIYFRIDEPRKEVQIVAVIYARRDQAKQLEKL
ncbi:type II toxin-antitoxin system RelE/ParE family toxin [Actinotignum sanguinis]|uniref:type II toxin-antitoxin system RelE/ParE family toxin n=1 Tax=Actinotignum sanguinis TaxID=1445614 RepID=UPI000F7DDDC0|nr:type II toxin-antitoxin system RelE/ParE family toxin [Actinotignum sanguinis]MDY5148060.1 type II toxin-antitoxin system RelE/ParE family toxin [Actinotignum sanguinis]RTE48487.1 type II toxin-antitoxin system RelE/ParE family toxin [Actinotignum sanguinis]